MRPHLQRISHYLTAESRAPPVGHSLLFARALESNGVPFALHVFPEGHHGLGLANDFPTVAAWKGLCARWLADAGS